MNEENEMIDEPLGAVEEEREAPAIPEAIPDKPKEQPEMSEVSTLGNIFFEPGRVFEDLRKKPRFILVSLIMLVAFCSFNVLLVEKIGFEKMVTHQMEASSQVQQMPAKDRQDLIKQQSQPAFKYVGYVLAPIIILITFLLGALLYFLGSKAFGGNSGFLQSLSIWTYSSFPPFLLFILANILILLFKSVDSIDLTKAQNRDLLQANPSLFVDGKEMPVLSALVSSFDLLAIWGYILAVIGLKVVTKISTGSAAAIVLIIALVGITAKVLAAFIF